MRKKSGWYLGFLCWMAMGVLAYASECAPLPPVEEAYASASSIFIGKVMKVRERSRNVKVSFKVYKVFKGMQDDIAVVLTSFPNDMGLGYPFQEGEQYLIFTYIQDAREYTNLCTRTKPFAQASAEIKILDKISRPE